MGVFFIFLWHLWSHYWRFLTSGPPVIEPMLDYLCEQKQGRDLGAELFHGLSLLH